MLFGIPTNISTLKWWRPIGIFKSGEKLSYIAVYLAIRDPKWLSTRQRPGVFIFNPNINERVAVTYSTRPLYSVLDVFAGVAKGPDGREYPVLVPGDRDTVYRKFESEYIKEFGRAPPPEAYSHTRVMCVFDPSYVGKMVDDCYKGFRPISIAIAADPEGGERLAGAFFRDVDGDGYEDIHLPYYRGYLLSISLVTGRQFVPRSPFDVSRNERNPGIPAGALFHSGRSKGAISSYVNEAGQHRVLMIGGDSVGRFSDFHCSVSRFVAQLKYPVTQTSDLEWTNYYSFSKGTFYPNPPGKPIPPYNSASPFPYKVPPKPTPATGAHPYANQTTSSFVRREDGNNLCIHYSSSGLFYSGSRPVAIYSVFEASDPTPKCLYQRLLERGGSPLAQTNKFIDCGNSNYAPRLGRWNVKVRELRVGAEKQYLRNRYLWGFVPKFGPDGEDLYLLEPMPNAVPFNRTGYTTRQLSVATLDSGTLKLQELHTFQVNAAPKVISKPNIDGGSTAGVGAGLNGLVTRDVNKDGLPDVQLEDTDDQFYNWLLGGTFEVRRYPRPS
jgi:hypothetical protein